MGYMPLLGCFLEVRNTSLSPDVRRFRFMMQSGEYGMASFVYAFKIKKVLAAMYIFRCVWEGAWSPHIVLRVPLRVTSRTNVREQCAMNTQMVRDECEMKARKCAMNARTPFEQNRALSAPKPHSSKFTISVRSWRIPFGVIGRYFFPGWFDVRKARASCLPRLSPVAVGRCAQGARAL
jgi:hypothetical protein